MLFAGHSITRLGGRASIVSQRRVPQRAAGAAERLDGGGQRWRRQRVPDLVGIAGVVIGQDE